jgi:hypothetical protein
MEVLIDEVDASIANHAYHSGEGRCFRARHLSIHLQNWIAATLSNGYSASFNVCLRRPHFD